MKSLIGSSVCRSHSQVVGQMVRELTDHHPIKIQGYVVIVLMPALHHEYVVMPSHRQLLHRGRAARLSNGGNSLMQLQATGNLSHTVRLSTVYSPT